MENKISVRNPFLAFIFTFVGGAIWIIVFQTVISRFFNENDEVSVMTSYAILFIILESILFIIAFLFVKKENDGNFDINKIGLNGKSKGLLWKGILLGASIQILIPILSQLEGFTTFKSTGFELYSSFSVVVQVFYFGLLMLFPGVCEEILFRGYIQRRLMEYRGKIFGFVIATSMFVFIHIATQTSIMGIAAILSLGALIGYLYIITGSIYITIGVHWVSDFLWNIQCYGTPSFGQKAVLIFSYNTGFTDANYVNQAILSIVAITIIVASRRLRQKDISSSK